MSRRDEFPIDENMFRSGEIKKQRFYLGAKPEEMESKAASGMYDAVLVLNAQADNGRAIEESLVETLVCVPSTEFAAKIQIILGWERIEDSPNQGFAIFKVYGNAKDATDLLNQMRRPLPEN